MTIIREMLLTSSYDFTHHTEKKVLTIDRKNCLPSSEKTAYRGQKKVLTADRKNSLPNDGKIILPRAPSPAFLRSVHLSFHVMFLSKVTLNSASSVPIIAILS